MMTVLHSKKRTHRDNNPAPEDTLMTALHDLSAQWTHGVEEGLSELGSNLYEPVWE